MSAGPDDPTIRGALSRLTSFVFRLPWGDNETLFRLHLAATSKTQRFRLDLIDRLVAVGCEQILSRW